MQKHLITHNKTSKTQLQFFISFIRQASIYQEA